MEDGRRPVVAIPLLNEDFCAPFFPFVEIISFPVPLARDPAFGPFRIGISRNLISFSWYFSRSSFVRGKRGILMRTKIALAPLSTREHKSIGKECLWDLREIMGLEDREATWLVEQEGIN